MRNLFFLKFISVCENCFTLKNIYCWKLITECESTVEIKKYSILKIHICDDNSIDKYWGKFSYETTYLCVRVLFTLMKISFQKLKSECESTVNIGRHFLFNIHICNDKSTNECWEKFTVENSYLWVWEYC